MGSVSCRFTARLAAEGDANAMATRNGRHIPRNLRRACIVAGLSYFFAVMGGFEVENWRYRVVIVKYGTGIRREIKMWEEGAVEAVLSSLIQVAHVGNL